ncbi:IclR family transcriptional regulator [Pseudonocardia sp. GCM10023141]|uniref:IclR family transcriptional regulator n=1 Tax=Pseudonocardia sp. GCM10023141 TaxID=3252653 RepID=UPI0036117152
MAKQATGQPLRSAERMLDVLECFSILEPSLSVAEISAKLDLAASTVRRLLHALEQHGFVRSDQQTGRFAPHYQIVRLAAVAVVGNDLISAASAPMDELRDRLDEAVQLSVRSGPDIVFIDRRESRKVIKIFSEIGSRHPAWDGRASGKVMLAWQPKDEVDEMLPPAGEWPVSAGPNAAAAREDFLADLAEVRARGFAVNDEETARDVWAVGAPVRDHTGGVVAVVTVPVLKVRAVERDRIDELCRAALDAARRISASLGHYEA